MLARQIPAAILLVSVVALTRAMPVSSQSRHVVINATRIADIQLQALAQQYRTRIPDGFYWYDRMSGAWGLEGGPTAGVTVAGLDVGGPLRPDASNGNTGVFIHGRQHVMDVVGLQALIGPVYQGRY